MITVGEKACPLLGMCFVLEEIGLLESPQI